MEAPTHWDGTQRRFCFEKLDAIGGDSDVLSRMQDVIDFVSEDLNLSPPQVIWIRPIAAALAAEAFSRWKRDSGMGQGCRPPVIWQTDDITEGYTPAAFPNEVWIRADLAAFPRLEFIAAHEIRHVWQKLKVPTVFDDPCKAEGDAYPYAYDLLERYLNATGKLTLELSAEIDAKREAARATYFATWPEGRFEVVAG